MNNRLYQIPEGIVFSNENIREADGVVYYPVYMAGLLEKDKELEEMIYRPDLSALM